MHAINLRGRMNLRSPHLTELANI